MNTDFELDVAKSKPKGVSSGLLLDDIGAKLLQEDPDQENSTEDLDEAVVDGPMASLSSRDKWTSENAPGEALVQDFSNLLVKPNRKANDVLSDMIQSIGYIPQASPRKKELFGRRQDNFKYLVRLAMAAPSEIDVWWAESLGTNEQLMKSLRRKFEKMANDLKTAMSFGTKHKDEQRSILLEIKAEYNYLNGIHSVWMQCLGLFQYMEACYPHSFVLDESALNVKQKFNGFIHSVPNMIQNSVDLKAAFGQLDCMADITKHEQRLRETARLNDWAENEKEFEEVLLKISDSQVATEAFELLSQAETSRKYQTLEMKLFQRTLDRDSLDWLCKTKDENLVHFFKGKCNLYFQTLAQTDVNDWQTVHRDVDVELSRIYDLTKRLKNIVKFSRLENSRMTHELQFIAEHLKKIEQITNYASNKKKGADFFSRWRLVKPRASLHKISDAQSRMIEQNTSRLNGQLMLNDLIAAAVKNDAIDPNLEAQLFAHMSTSADSMYEIWTLSLSGVAYLAMKKVSM